MNTQEVLQALTAIAHEGRLELLRLLIQRGPGGTAVGDLAAASGLKFGTASAQLAVLEKAGVVRSERDGRSMLYTPQFTTMIGLVTFLIKDCCGGADSRMAACCELLDCLPNSQGETQ